MKRDGNQRCESREEGREREDGEREDGERGEIGREVGWGEREERMVRGRMVREREIGREVGWGEREGGW